MSIGFLGPEGTFSEAAAHAFGSALNCSYTAFPTIPDVLDAVCEERSGFGVVPMENSIEGTVHVTIDGLLSRKQIHIVQELVLPIQQRLLMIPGATLTDIREVWSHPQGLAQCRHTIRKLGAREVAFASTAAAAAELIVSSRRDVAVIASAMAAQRYGLQTVQAMASDTQDNWTRFAVIASESKTDRLANQADRAAETGNAKTMIVVIPRVDHAGVLASILSVFATLGLNLSWIESRPTREALGRYQFCLEIETPGLADELMTAGQVLEAFGHEVRWLGSYSTTWIT